MRLIDADKIVRYTCTIDRDHDYEVYDIEHAPTVDAIPVEWMWQTFYELMYDGEKLTDKDKTVLSKLIDRWEKQNDGQANH